MNDIVTPFDSADRMTFPGRIVRHIRRDGLLALFDIAVVVPAYLLPFVLIYDGAVPDNAWRSFWTFLPVVVIIHLLTNFLFGLYGQMWRFASVQEARRVLLAGSLALILILGLDEFLYRNGWELRPMPISVVILGSALSLMAFGAIRFQSRLFAVRRRAATVETSPELRVLVMGAGEAGAQIVADVLRHPELRIRIVGLLDDDPRRVGLSLHDVRVIGGRADLPRIVQERRVDQVLLAIPGATSDLIRDVAARCEGADVSLRVLPSMREVVGDRVTVRDLRDLVIEDLLGREQVETDLEAVRALLRGRRVLITGAGGSIGSEIARQVASFGPEELIVLDHDETLLHDLVGTLQGDAATCVLADIRDRGRTEEIFRRHRPEVVFHAAAHKHVPILEAYPDEAFLTNVRGTANVAAAALSVGADRFVLISTDKAVNPSSVMGGSKRLAEEIVRGSGGLGTSFCAVRFGNVVGSRGSVIPTFLRQIQAGGPVTVTDPEMTRYFMSVREAVQLVLQAATMASGGEVFTLEMGQPVGIMELAHKLIRMSGRVPGRDIAIEVIGPRPGEKRHEELAEDDEHPVPSGYPGIVVATASPPDIAALQRRLGEMDELAERGDADGLAVALRGPGRAPEPAAERLELAG